MSCVQTGCISGIATSTFVYWTKDLQSEWQGLSRLCVQRVIWTPRTMFFDSLDTQKFLSGFADDDSSHKIVHVVSLL